MKACRCTIPRWGLQLSINFPNYYKDVGSLLFTMFSDADVQCMFVRKLYTSDHQRVLLEVLTIEGKGHTFQFHFNTLSKLGAVDFTLDDVLNEAVNVDATIELPEDFPVLGTPPSLESTTLEDTGKTMVNGETRTICVKRLNNEAAVGFVIF
ncbi:hypothetical protein Tco_1041616 [Tanacetum coccineum]|uniref:Uncharacterized protein n=1 Tax=Tanacetum coccineum TaxID=301880 RepID=A0ABQ5GI38_9ASTR